MFTCVLFHKRVRVCVLLIECVTLLCKTQTKPRDKHLIHIFLRHSKSNIDKFCRQCETNALIKIKHNNRSEKKGCCMQRALACSRSLSLSRSLLPEKNQQTQKKNAMANAIGSEWQRARGGAGEARSLCAKVARGIRHRPLSMQMKRVGKQSHRKRERDEWMSWVKVKWLFATLSERVKLLCKNCRGNLHSDRTSMCTCVRARVCAYVHACSICFSFSLSLVFGSSSLSSSAR